MMILTTVMLHHSLDQFTPPELSARSLEEDLTIERREPQKWPRG